MKLKPCPFCGGKPTLSERKSYATWHRVICLNSMCVICPSTAEFEDKEEAIKAWNRREPIDKIVEQLEQMLDFEERTGRGYCPDYDDDECRFMYSDLGCSYCAFKKAIEIVKGGAV